MLSQGLRAAAGPSYIFYNTAGNTATSATTHTFNNVSIGTPQSNRIVVVLAIARTTAETKFLNCTINGTSANNRIGTASGNADTVGPRIVSSLFVPNGTTANIVFTLGQNTVNGLAFHVYSIYGPASDVSAGWVQDIPASSGTSLSMTPSLTAGDIVLAQGYKVNANGATWTNATQDSSIATTTGTSHSASVIAPSTASRTITMSWSGSVGNGGILAFFR
jgi:hypothetical protein